MNHPLVVLICLALLASTDASAQQSSSQTKLPVTQARQKSLRELVMTPVVLTVPGMDRVTVKSNLKYTNANDLNLLMDVYAPPGLGKQERRPAVVFIHGSAGSFLKPKDWGVYQSWGRLIAASGMIAVTFTHR